MAAARHETPCIDRDDDRAPARAATLLDFEPPRGPHTAPHERRVHAPRRQGDRRGAHDAAADERSADIAARLLGPFALQVRGVAVLDWPASRAKSLLKYLLLHRGRPLARQAVLDAFWPEIDAEAARNNLHVAIHRLRRLLQAYGLGPEAVRCADGVVGFDPALSVWLDTEQFEAALTAAQGPEGAANEAALGAALALARGDIVAADRGEAWIEPLRHHFSDRRLLALQRLAEARLAAGDEAACIEHAQAMLAIDVCNEAAHRLLMRCHGRLAQPARVDRQYRACVQALRTTLGVGPHAQTTALYRALFAAARSA